jgi:hypothetical protein
MRTPWGSPSNEAVYIVIERPKMTRVWMWSVVVALFVVIVFALWGMCGGVPFVNSLVGPLVARYYTPGIELLLFGPAAASFAISVWLIVRTHRRWNRPVRTSSWLILSVLTLLAAYLGGFFAFNSFGT